MTINHLNLIVTDVTRNVNFFETYFNFKCEAVKGDNVLAVLKNTGDFTLVLMKGEEASYPKDFHIGFMVDSEEEVEAIHKKLLDGQINITRAPGKIRNSFGFYFYFDNLFIEVGHYLN
ncbi:VOC family protein [Chitinophaga tropicalis]|uniref:VOC family protein n=1 Tax=Chitinophaga tropicalis TaxID=2683588 RepID=A0A7K1U6F1_9BACT|nr:VOC family protein [Chitinophaga tropicalis]MVT09919.1 VOC family protein [Chitinophaga tropicalis]